MTCFVLDIDDCVNNSCLNGECEDGINNYTCSCNEGWEGENCEQSKSYIEVVIFILFVLFVHYFTLF